jgi:hypothetical protein
MNENMALALRDNARNELMKIKDVESGVDYLNKVKAIEVWAKAEKKDAELQTLIAEQKIRTQRILGKLLHESEISKSGYAPMKKVESNDTTPLRLSDIGLTKDQSSAFQKIKKNALKKTCLKKAICLIINTLIIFHLTQLIIRALQRFLFLQVF